MHNVGNEASNMNKAGALERRARHTTTPSRFDNPHGKYFVRSSPHHCEFFEWIKQEGGQPWLSTDVQSLCILEQNELRQEKLGMTRRVRES